MYNVIWNVACENFCLDLNCNRGIIRFIMRGIFLLLG